MPTSDLAVPFSWRYAGREVPEPIALVAPLAMAAASIRGVDPFP